MELSESYPLTWRLTDVGAVDPWPSSSPFSFPKRALYLWPRNSSVFLDANGGGETTVSRPGEAEVTLEVVARADPSRQELAKAVAVIAGVSARITLTSGVANAVTLELPAAAVAAAVRELGIR